MDYYYCNYMFIVIVATRNIVVCNCSLCSSYSLLFNSLNMSSNNMLLRRKTNAKEVVVDKLATKRLYRFSLLSHSFRDGRQEKIVGINLILSRLR